MLIVVADAVVKPENRDRMEEAGPAMVVPSRQEEGCLGYSYAWDMIEPNRLRIIELWKDEAALRFHFRTPHMAAFLKALGEMANSPPAITVYEAGAAHDIGRYMR